MADAPAAKKPKRVEPSKWARERPKPDSMIEKRRALWNALNAFVMKSWRLDRLTAGNAKHQDRGAGAQRATGEADRTWLSSAQHGASYAAHQRPGAVSSWVVVDVIAISLPR